MSALVLNRKVILIGLGWLVCLVGLYVSGTYNYLLFHSLAIIFSIMIAVAIFALAWTSMRVSNNKYPFTYPYSITKQK